MQADRYALGQYWIKGYAVGDSPWLLDDEATNAWINNEEPSAVWASYNKPSNSWVNNGEPSGSWTPIEKPANSWSDNV